MRIEQLSQVLGQGKTDKATVSNADRMRHAISKVLNEDARLMSKGKKAYEEARRRDFERKRQEAEIPTPPATHAVYLFRNAMSSKKCNRLLIFKEF